MTKRSGPRENMITREPNHVRRARRLSLLIPSPLVLCATARAEDTPAGRAFFETKIRPVLVEHCFKCHSSQAAAPKAGLRLDTRAGLQRGGKSGPIVVPGAPDESPLIQ